MKRTGEATTEKERTTAMKEKIVCYNSKLLCLFSVCDKILHTKSAHRRSHARMAVKECANRNEKETVKANGMSERERERELWPEHPK